MTPLEIEYHVRNISMIQEHELLGEIIHAWMREGFDNILHRKTWSWLQTWPEQIQDVDDWFALADLENDVHTILSVHDASTRRQLKRVSIQDLVYFGGGETPELHNAYCVFDDKIWFDLTYHFEPVTTPPSATDSGTDDYNILYLKKPSFIAYSEAPYNQELSSNVEMPAHYEMALVDWCLQRAWERQEDFDRSDAYRVRFEAKVGSFMKEDNLKNEDKPKIAGETRTHGRRYPHGAVFIDQV